MRRAFRQPRGAASVETAISMIIIIPVFMYALFLDDLLRYAADVQETVTSTPWDFTTQDYNQPNEKGLKNVGATAPAGGGTAVQHLARLMYCDHESSGDSYNDSQDCDALDHHEGRAVSGHVCWLNSGAHQVTCEAVDTSVGSLGGQYDDYKGEFGTGGLFQCHAKAVVENYLMPKTFLQKFSQVDMSKENWKDASGDIHSNAVAGTNDTAYYLAQQDFAIITDTWALNDSPESGVDLAVEPGTKSGPVYDRVNNVYSGNTGYTYFNTMNTTFRTALFAKNLLIPGVGDNPATPNVSTPPPGQSTQEIDQDEGGSQNYFSTPWQDGAGDAYRETYDARGDFYMGCSSAEGC